MQRKIHFSLLQSKAKTIFARPTQIAAASQATGGTLNSIQTANGDNSRVKKTSKYVHNVAKVQVLSNNKKLDFCVSVRF